METSPVPQPVVHKDTLEVSQVLRGGWGGSLGYDPEGTAAPRCLRSINGGVIMTPAWLMKLANEQEEACCAFARC